MKSCKRMRRSNAVFFIVISVSLQSGMIITTNTTF